MSQMSLFSSYVSTQIGSQLLITLTELKQKRIKRMSSFARRINYLFKKYIFSKIVGYIFIMRLP